MTLAMQKFEAFGTEVDEPLTKQFIQRAVFTFTGANTDVDIDFGDYTGTFWTAVGSTEPGTTALKAIKDIQIRARSFISIGGNAIAGYVQADAAITTVMSLTSAATAGGARTQTMTVTGLAATDTILGVTQSVEGDTQYQYLMYTSAATAGGLATQTLTVTGVASTDTILAVTPSVEGDTKYQTLYYESGALSGGADNETITVTGLAATDNILATSMSTKNGTTTVALTGWSDQGANSLKAYFTANPGAGGKVRVVVQRAGGNSVTAYSTPGTNTISVTWATVPGTGAKVNVLVARAGGNGVVAWSTPGTNNLSVTWATAPGTGAKATVVFTRSVSSVVAGTYQLAMDGTNTNIPNLLFVTGDAPTSYVLTLQWLLKAQQDPVRVTASA